MNNKNYGQEVRERERKKNEQENKSVVKLDNKKG